MPKQKFQNPADAQIVYIGLDVHLKQWNVCVIQGGIQRKAFQQPADVRALLTYLHRVYPGMEYRSAYEAGVCGCSIHYALEQAGVSNIIFHAADISQTHKERVRKTDAVDAAKIARALANGELCSVHVPPQWRFADRNLLRLRYTQISDIKRSKARLRHFLHVNGIRIPEEFRARHWPIAFMQWLEQTAASDPSVRGSTLSAMVQSLERAMAELKDTDRRLQELMDTAPYLADYELLRTVPGVGFITAASLLLECGDLTDFSSAEAFCAYVGLIPDMDKSDEHEGYCPMTRRRHRSLRYMLTECAWRAIRTDEHLSSLFATYCRRMPSTKSIVKIANKLAKIIKFVLKNKKPYARPE